tara:strand:+ start:7509 stop:7850 length:342 start_codon:yes stop_codon:yes gene_type:complete
MQTQLSIFDLLERLENSDCVCSPIPEIPIGEDGNLILDEEIPFIRENLLIETVRSAFGVSRGGRSRTPDDESWDWITSDEHGSPFSFRNCCLSTGVNPDDLLEWLFWYRKKLN